MKISILLPYKENFSSLYAGAVSLMLKDTIKLSKFRNQIKIFGNTNFKKILFSKQYINLPIKKKIFQSSTNIYLKQFINYEVSNPSKIIEIHNRPNYIKKISNINKNIVLYFHNDPLNLKGSKSKNDRIELLKKTKKIIFISNWVKNRFFFDLQNLKRKTSNYKIITHSTNKVKIDLNKKKNLILFIGRLNLSKGYDIFGEAIIKILNKHNNWKAIVYGDEPRENIFFKHKNLRILGFRKHNEILDKLKIANISIACSRWDEPFGRTALEASSRGCAVIISNRGGLPEAASNGIKINKLNSKSLFNSINKIILNKKYRKLIQKKTLKNFDLTNENISKKIDNYRNDLIKS
jgi:glycosyltransferase involved in cell wall biosynthesis